MALSVGSAYATLEARDAFSSTFNKFNNILNVSVGDLMSAAKNLNIFSAGIGAMAAKAVMAAAQWEQTTIAFNTLLGSADTAREFLQEMQDFAAKTPFELPGLLEGARRLLAMGFAADQVKPMLTAVGDAAAGLGVGGEGIQRITLALGQMQAKGKVSAEEMRQLAEAGIPAWEFLAEKIGVSIPQAMDMAQKGAIKAADALPALVEGMNKKFGGMMEAQSKTLLGMWSTVKDEMGFVLRDIGSAITPMVKVWLDGFMSLLPAVRELAVVLAEVAGAIMEVIGEAGALAVEFVSSLGPAASGLADEIKDLTGGTVDFNTALKNAAMFGDVIRLAWVGLQGAVVNLSLRFQQAAYLLSRFTNATEAQKKEMRDNIAATEALTVQLGNEAQSLIQGEKHWEKMAEAQRKGEAQTKKNTKATDELTKEQAKLQKKLDEIASQFTGSKVQDEMNELAMAFKNVNLAEKVTGQGAQALAEKIRALQTAGATIPPTFLAFAESIEAANQQMEQMGPFIDRFSGGIALLPNLMHGSGSFGKDLLAGVPASKTTFIEAGTEGGAFIGKGMFEGIKKSLGAALNGLPNVIMQAITGGGDIGQAIGGHLGQSIGQDLGKMLGEKVGGFAGKALGSVVPVLGTLAGSFLGSKLGGLIGGLFGGGEEKKVNDMRDQFLAMQGGWEALQKKLATISDQDLVKKIFDAKTVDQFNAAVSEAMGLLDLQGQAQEETRAALEKYGIEISKTSQAWAQSEINQQALGFWKEFKLITEGAGVSVSDAISAMGDKGFTDFVNQARAAGATLPEQLRPMVEELIRSGQILDENGEAFGTAEEAGITFAQSLEESFAKVGDQLQRMIDLLQRMLGMPTPNVPNMPNAPGSGAPPRDLPYGGQGWQERYQHGGAVTRPTVGLVGEAGPELITPMFMQSEGQFLPLKFDINNRTLVDALVELKTKGAYGFGARFNRG